MVSSLVAIARAAAPTRRMQSGHSEMWRSADSRASERRRPSTSSATFSSERQGELGTAGWDLDGRDEVLLGRARLALVGEALEARHELGAQLVAGHDGVDHHLAGEL